jgi:Ca2+-binding RTX toxin-like protein
MITKEIPGGNAEYLLNDSYAKWVLDAGVERMSATHGIKETSALHDNVLEINGVIDAGDAEYFYGIDAGGLNTTIRVGDTGEIDGLIGINSGGDGALIVNDGLVYGVRYGIYSYGEESRIINNGTIDGENDPKYNTAAVNINSETDARFTNNGIIEGGVNGRALQLMMDFSKTSVIHGGVDIISKDGDKAVITNLGELFADNPSGWAFYGRDGNEKFVNRGTIDGGVGLGTGNDTYDGRGGKVNDYIHGDVGDDTFIIDTRKIELSEYENQGIDTVKSTVSFSLDVKYGYELENLTLLGVKNVNGFGNGLDNVIRGNSGDNRLFGGAGEDMLTGGKGADVFVFKSNSGIDEITDFGKGADRIDLRALSDVTDFADLMKNHVKLVDGHVVIHSGSDELHLLDVSKQDLQPADFML